MSTLALAFNPQNKAITTYSNFNFTGSHCFKGRTLFIGTGGLFEYGGTHDNGTAIQPSMKTGKMNAVMGQQGPVSTDRLKRIPTCKIYVSCNKSGGSLTLNVNVDGTVYSYATAINHNGFATHAIPIGRAIRYNFMQLELVASNCAVLDIDAIIFDPIALQRGER